MEQDGHLEKENHLEKDHHIYGLTILPSIKFVSVNTKLGVFIRRSAILTGPATIQ